MSCTFFVNQPHLFQYTNTFIRQSISTLLIRAIVLTSLLLIISSSYSQTYILGRGGTVKFYGNIPLEANLISPTGDFTVRDEQTGRGYDTKPFNPPIFKESLYEVMGEFYSGTSVPTSLFGLANQDAYFPLLDSIDMTFYKESSLKDIGPKFINDELFKTFKDDFKKAETVKKRKDLLELDEYSKYKEALIQTKYKISIAPFQNQREVEKKIRAGIIADIQTKIEAYKLKAEAQIMVEIEKLINSNVRIEGSYNTITFSKEYISKIEFFFKKFDKNINDIRAKFDDQFTIKLLEWWDSKTARIITGACIVKMNFKYEYAKVNTTAVDVILKAAGVSEEIRTELAAKVYMSFYMRTSVQGSAEVNDYFALSYTCSEVLESFGAQPD